MKRSVLLATLLAILIFCLSGCGNQLGETKAEVDRRHSRNLRIHKEEMASDIETLLLLDQPSKLSERKIP